MGSEAPPQLSYFERSPPIGAIAAAALAGAPIDAKVDPKFNKDSQPVLIVSGDRRLEGLPYILRYVARAGEAAKLYGSTVMDACEVDQWIDFSSSLVAGSGLEVACGLINQALSLSTFLVNYALSMADVACWGQLQGTPQWDKLKKSGAFPHLARWYDFLSEVPQLRATAEAFGPRRRKTAAEVSKEAAASGKGGGDTGSFDIDLPGAAEGKVVTRFPPEPSGYMHLGHAKAALLNQFFAQHYKGRLLLRFDDTNPSKEKDEFVDNILKDLEAVGVRYDRMTHTSDYFAQMLDMAERLIKAGKLYADDTPMEAMRTARMAGEPSPCRERTVDENLALFREMQNGTEIGKKNCLRFKINYNDKNGALRDPTAYRCNDTPHLRTGTQYSCYPTYDFACPFVDSWEGVTHALRTSEYKDREDQFYWILRAMQAVWPGLPDVHIWDFSRLSFVYTVLSKRKLTWFVETGRVDGWDDPRMPTVQGMLRRGLTLEALKEFILSQGASKNVTVQEWDKIWTMNKKVIDPVCARHTAVEAAGRVRLALADGPAEAEVVDVPKHKKNPAVGTKQTTKSKVIWLDGADAAAVGEGEEVTLMDWGNAVVRSKTVDPATGTVTALDGGLHLEGSVKSTKLKLTWLADIPDLVELTLADFGHLISKKKLEEGDDFEACVNDVTKWETAAYGDANMRSLKKGDIIQLERKGYYIVDRPYEAGKPMVLFSIPDGRSKTMAANS